MGDLIDLARLCLELKKDGVFDLSADLLAAQYRERTGQSLPGWYIRHNLPKIAAKIYQKAPHLSQHLVSEEYFANPVEFKVHHSQYVASIQMPLSEECELAYTLLPIGCASAGIRFAKPRNDYLLFVWYAVVSRAADAKERARAVKEITAFKNDHLPISALRYLMNRHVATIPDAINGTEGLPTKAQQPLLDIKKLMRELPGCWEKNFGEE